MIDFCLPHVYILGKNYCAGKQHEMFMSLHNTFYCKCTRFFAERWQVLSEQVPSQYLSGCKSISMEVVALEKFIELKTSTVPMPQFHYHLSDEIDQYDRTNATHTCNIFKSLLTK